MRDELLLYYERELDYLRKSAAQFAEKHPKVASRLVLEPTKCEDPHVERLLEGVRLSGCPRSPQARRRISRDHRGAAQRCLPATGAAHSVHVGRRVPTRSGKGQADQRLEDRAQLPALFQAHQRRSLHLSHLLRHHAVAHHRERRGAEPAEPPQAARQDQRLGLGDPPRTALRARMSTSSRLKPDKLRFYLDGESGLVNILYELLFSRLNRIQIRDLTPGSRLAPCHSAGICAQCGRIRSQRRHGSVSFLLLRRPPPADGVLRLSGEVLLHRSGRPRSRCRRRIQRRDRSHLPALRH